MQRLNGGADLLEQQRILAGYSPGQVYKPIITPESYLNFYQQRLAPPASSQGLLIPTPVSSNGYQSGARIMSQQAQQVIDGDPAVDPNAWGNMTTAQQAAYYSSHPTMAALAKGGMNIMKGTSLGLLSQLFDPKGVQNHTMIAYGFDPNDMGSSMGTAYGGQGLDAGYLDSYAGEGESPDDNASVSGYNTEAQQAADGNGGDGSASKIICTAMNHAYGFGSFRNAIWIDYSNKHLTKAHEVGYHTLFLPLVDYGFKRGDGKLNVAVRKVLEWGTRHRSTDLRAEMRGTKRDTTGRIIRFIFEPLCFAVGKLKGY